MMGMIQYMPLYKVTEIVGFTIEKSVAYDKITKIWIELDGKGQQVYYEFEQHGGGQKVDESRIVEPKRTKTPLRYVRSKTYSGKRGTEPEDQLHENQ